MSPALALLLAGIAAPAEASSFRIARECAVTEPLVIERVAWNRTVCRRVRDGGRGAGEFVRSGPPPVRPEVKVRRERWWPHCRSTSLRRIAPAKFDPRYAILGGAAVLVMLVMITPRSIAARRETARVLRAAVRDAGSGAISVVAEGGELSIRSAEAGAVSWSSAESFER